MSDGSGDSPGDVVVPRRDVFVVDEQAEIRVDLERYVRLVRHVLDEEGVRPEAELSLMFVDEATMADLHLRFMGLEGGTDVLAFPMDEELVETGRQPDQGGRGPGAPPESDEVPVLVGDVVVCPPVAERQAGEYGRSVEAELDLLVAHGILHLLEYDHEHADDAARMRAREREILESFEPFRSSGPGAEPPPEIAGHPPEPPPEGSA